MKTISIQLLLFIIISSCGCRQSNDLELAKKHNYVVILDLSDRLLDNDQAGKDSAIILAAFNVFEKTARNPLIVTSNDRFTIRIIPQKGSLLHKDDYENKLNIDLSTIDAARKNSAFVAFKNELSNSISRLYKEAHLGNTTNDYAGVDIWMFFNNEINSELRNGAENKVVILTDGYFDFNDNSHVIHNRNQHTNTNFINGLYGKDWQIKAERDSIGLIPVSIKTKASWVISGIHPKNLDPVMPVKLEYFWGKWLKESGAGNPQFILDNAGTVMVNQYNNL